MGNAFDQMSAALSDTSNECIRLQDKVAAMEDVVESAVLWRSGGRVPGGKKEEALTDAIDVYQSKIVRGITL